MITKKSCKKKIIITNVYFLPKIILLLNALLLYNFSRPRLFLHGGFCSSKNCALLPENEFEKKTLVHQNHHFF